MNPEKFRTTRGLNFWCRKVFGGGQVTFLINFENAVLVRSIFSEISDHVSNCDFGAFSNDQK